MTTAIDIAREIHWASNKHAETLRAIRDLIRAGKHQEAMKRCIDTAHAEENFAEKVGACIAHNRKETLK